MFMPDWLPKRALIISLSNYASVLLALYVAFALNLQNPWWAMLTVYFVQPPQRLTGAIWAKAAYRAAGTIVAGMVAIVMIPALANSASLLVLAVAAWLGLCTFVGVLDRTPRSYFFMLAGYTVVLTAMPAAFEPNTIFDVMVSRVEEILIGVLAVAVVQSIFFPASVADAAMARLDGLMAKMRDRIAEGALKGQPGPSANGLAVELTALDLLASDWRFEGTLPLSKRSVLFALEERLVALLPATTAVADRLENLRDMEGADSEASALADRVAAWVRLQGPAQAAARQQIEEDIDQSAPVLEPASTGRDLLWASFVTHLRNVVRLWCDCQMLATVIADPDDAASERALLVFGGVSSRALHRDPRQAALSGLVAMITLAALGFFSMATRWEFGVYAMGIAAVPCSLFAFADDPRPMTRDLVFGLLAIFPVLFIYQFAVLPRLDGFLALALSVFPVLFPLGVAANIPKYAFKSLGMLAGFSAGLALQPSFNSSLPLLLNLYFAVLIGAIAALAVIGLIRVIPAERAVARLLQAGWREMADYARDPAGTEAVDLKSRMVDRVGLLFPRLQALRGPALAESDELLRDVGLAHALVELAKLRSQGDTTPRPEIDAALRALAKHLDRLAEIGREGSYAHLVDSLDAAASRILRLDSQADRRAGTSAVASLRRAVSPMSLSNHG